MRKRRCVNALMHVGALPFQPKVRAASETCKQEACNQELNARVVSDYDKLRRTELSVSATLVLDVARKLRAVNDSLGVAVCQRFFPATR